MSAVRLCDFPRCHAVAVRKFENVVPAAFACLRHADRMAHRVALRMLIVVACDPEGFDTQGVPVSLPREAA